MKTEITKTYHDHKRHAECRDCQEGPWTAQNAVAAAAIHARRYGHTVDISVSHKAVFAPVGREPKPTVTTHRYREDCSCGKCGKVRHWIETGNRDLRLEGDPREAWSEGAGPRGARASDPVAWQMLAWTRGGAA